jgi:uncharacterized membrane protein YgdD (TMEM256/DUF423 family)
MMNPWLSLAGIYGLGGVVIGAFGAHNEALNDTTRAFFETALDWHMLHSLALLGAAILVEFTTNPARKTWLNASSVLFATGTILFSGTLYMKAFTSITLLPLATPTGGILLMLGWSALIAAGFTDNTGNVQDE